MDLPGVLQRWIELDKALSTGGLWLFKFAKKHKVNAKTIRRDIEIIEQVTGLNVDYDYRRKTYSYRVERAPPFGPVFNHVKMGIQVRAKKGVNHDQLSDA